MFPAGGNVPADHLRLLYTPSRALPFELGRDVGATLPRMYRLEGAIKVNVPYEIEYEGTVGMWLTPTTEQPLGTQLVIESDASQCELDAPLRTTYSITEKRPHLPTTLGTLSANVARALVSVDTGSCSEVADVAYADLRIALSDEALPFASLWHYQLYVDGLPHERSATSGHLARVLADCSGIDAGVQRSGALEPGTHVVHLTAQLGDEPPLSTPPLELALRCDDQSEAVSLR